MIYKPANIISRIMAICIDHLLLFVIMVLVYQYLFHGDINNIQLPGQIYIYFFLINFLYFFIFELIFHKTIGKKILNLEIIRTDHQKPQLINVFLRNLIRPIDMIGFYMLGMVFVVFTAQNQRLGDILGQTYVIKSID